MLFSLYTDYTERTIPLQIFGKIYKGGRFFAYGKAKCGPERLVKKAKSKNGHKEGKEKAGMEQGG